MQKTIGLEVRYSNMSFVYSRCLFWSFSC
ncbi:hypothetical protein Godav_006456 [Gossypium davidsonii]|uniref:Uncharacterized protein n=2 Tax=Gossypium TaxID=3633 RepID=A0A7J8S425_GOSDV|nr:hypothetical protein [Gossypium davidsonii]MBA0656217.1 hypothetical protein [Gossypium klotzschianum]